MASRLINIPMASTLNKAENRELLGAFTGFNLMQGHPEQDSGVYPYFKKQFHTSRNIAIDKEGNTWSEKDGNVLKNDEETGIKLNLDKSYLDEEVKPYRSGKWYKIEIKQDYVVYINSKGIYIDWYNVLDKNAVFFTGKPSAQYNAFNEKTSIDLSYDPIVFINQNAINVIYKDENGRWYLFFADGYYVHKLFAFSNAASKTLSKRPQGRLNVFWDAIVIYGKDDNSNESLIGIPVNTAKDEDKKKENGELASIDSRVVYLFKVDYADDVLLKWNGKPETVSDIVGKPAINEIEVDWQNNDLTTTDVYLPLNRRMYAFNYEDGNAYSDFTRWNHNEDGNITSIGITIEHKNVKVYEILYEYFISNGSVTWTPKEKSFTFIVKYNDKPVTKVTEELDENDNTIYRTDSGEVLDSDSKYDFCIYTYDNFSKNLLETDDSVPLNEWEMNIDYKSKFYTSKNTVSADSYSLKYFINMGDDIVYDFASGLTFKHLDWDSEQLLRTDRPLINPYAVERWIYMMKGTVASTATRPLWDINKDLSVFHSSVISTIGKNRHYKGTHWYGAYYDNNAEKHEFTDRWMVAVSSFNAATSHPDTKYCVDWSQDYPLITEYNDEDCTMNKFPFISSSLGITAEGVDNRYQSTKYLPLGNTGFYFGIQTVNNQGFVDDRRLNYAPLLQYSLYGNISGNVTYSSSNLGTPITSIVYVSNNQYQGTLAEPLYSIDYNEIIPSYHNNDVFYKATNGKYVRLTAEKITDKNLFNYARQRYILVNTTDFYNCIDTEENRLTHYGWRYELPALAITHNADDIGGEYYPTYEVHTWGVGINPYFAVNSNAIERSSFPINNSGEYATYKHYLGDLGHVRFCPASYVDGISKSDNEVQFSVGKSAGDTPTYKYTQPYRIAYKYFDNQLADTSQGRGLLGYQDPQYIDMVTATTSGLYRCLTPGNVIKNFDGNTSIVKAGGYFYYMSTSNGKLMTVYNTDTQVQDFDSMFFIQSSVYGVYDKYIYLLAWSSGNVSISTPICEVADMKFIGNSTEFAYFYSKQDKAIYYFDGTRKLKYFSLCSYWNDIGEAKYNLYDGMIYLPTDKGLYIFQQNIESFLENIGNEKSTITVTDKGIVVDDLMIKKYKTEEDDEVIPVKIETKMYGDPNFTQVQCSEWIIRLVKPGTVKASTDVLTDKLIIGDTKEYECKDLMLRFKPKLQTGSGVRLKLETESPIYMLSVQADAHGVQISKSTM